VVLWSVWCGHLSWPINPPGFGSQT
jgi:hypothetical protein